ncbi:MAG: tRNA (adenosine(37)-N6)-dimethylallyltransferase MiaA [Gammaproteobacteria bacterium]|nr:tRNA (adenosine(37)-N6)-dimethylallyltransferase MiaA [Gammaproteobacteria bacterium]
MTIESTGLPVIFLMGPTASGKTKLAIELCGHLPVEIVSVDSAMVYKEMDIGTAKPSTEILARYPHSLINICDPSEIYSAGDFRQDALKEINRIQSEGKIPLLVGGTGLYFRALEQGIADLPSANTEIRLALLAEAAQIGWRGMHDRLIQIDAEAAKRIHPNDPQRIQRALEVHAISGRTMSSFFRDSSSNALTGPLCKIIIAPVERAQLHERIRLRFMQMMELGLLEEVIQLYKREDLSAELPAMKTVGYRQVWQYLDGSISKDEMLEKAVVATRQLAKRQLTWLRSEQDCQWFDCLEEEFEVKVLKFLLNDPIIDATL